MKKTSLLAALTVALGTLVSAVGCGNAAQREAFAQASAREQHITIGETPALIADYQQVVALAPDSSIAHKARNRIEALEARIKAHGAHKEADREHGID